MAYPTIIEKSVQPSADIIHPFIELKRSQCFKYLYNQYLSQILCDETEKVFARKGSEKNRFANDVALRLFGGWLFRQYSLRVATDDPLIPSGGGDVSPLIESLVHVLEYDFELSKSERSAIAESIIKRVNFDFHCKVCLESLASFQNQYKIFFSPSTYAIKKQLFTETGKNGFSIDYIVLELMIEPSLCAKLGFDLQARREVRLPETVYQKLCKSYETFSAGLKQQDKDMLIWCLVLRYETIDTRNFQLGVPPEIFRYLNRQLGLETELFASGINHTLPRYCSLFFDIEQYFGSLGSFFEIKPKQGLFTANPPYENSVMELMAKRLVECLIDSEKTNFPLAFVSCIPVWDEKGRALIESMTGAFPGSNSPSDYGGYPALEVLERSGFLVNKRLLTINDSSYTDHSKQHPNKRSGAVYILTLCNSHFKEDLSIINRLNFSYPHAGELLE